ncbi:sensor histidine kinase [Aquimarina sp. Aq78]|uniref:sensor histidine kinase n=1 Tax=Aquimarina sp. Aq78 TaxID=1191889 RepID=UPI000D0F3C50|nr:histidine kinase [Aquimarina sp. Aq78]
MSLKNKISIYWKCQMLGWGLVSLYWLYITVSRDDYSIFFAISNYLLDIAIGILLTHIYRTIALKFDWVSLSLGKLVLKVIPSVILLAFGFMILGNLKWYFFWVRIANQNFGLYQTLFDWDPIFITGLRLMSIWLLSYHLYSYHKREVNTSKLNAQLLTLAKQAQIDNLQAQLNPHFLFNSLNSIKSLIIENPLAARRSIDLLSDLLRSSLHQKDNELVSIKKELLLVEDYFELEKIRLEDRLEYVINLDASLEPFNIPKFSIQLLVENAIKHGIDKYIKGGFVNVSIMKENDFIVIKVENPGKIMMEKSKGIGLENLKERLNIQFDGKAHFSIKEKAKNLITANIKIPQ